MPTYSWFEEKFGNSYKHLIDVAAKGKCLSNNIVELIICEDVAARGKAFVHKDSVFAPLTQEKEFTACGRIYFEDGRYIIIVDGVNVNPMTPMFNKVILELIIQIWVEETILNKEPHRKLALLSDGYHSFLEKSVYSWYAMYKAKLLYDEIITGDTYQQSLDDFSIFTDNFKRKIKKHHYIYQNDTDQMGLFLLMFLEECYQLIKHVLSYYRYSKNTDFVIDPELSLLISPIICQVLKAFECIDHGACVEIDDLKFDFDKLLEFGFLKITDHEDGTQNIEVTDDPKTLFKDKLTDTEQRIVAFIDILGFKAIIDEYDNQALSNILKDLQMALNTAIDTSINQILSMKGNENIKEHLKYRMFSDCLSISLPFYDNDTDFIIQFNSLSIIINAYVQTMALKGFFLRGGIATGSYYSDENMIFSGGLVKAYELESRKAIYPRIVIDDTIVKKLLHSRDDLKTSFGIERIILLDNSDNTCFLNSFDVLDKMKHDTNFLMSTMDDAIGDLRADGDPTISAYASLLESLNKSLIKPQFDLLSEASEAIKQSTQIILDIVQDNIVKFESEPKVKLKYQWLLQYLVDVEGGFPTERFSLVHAIFNDKSTKASSKTIKQSSIKNIIVKYRVAIIIYVSILNLILLLYNIIM